MSNLRELIKARIIRGYNNGLNELGDHYFNYAREREGRPLLAEQFLDDWDYTPNPEFDIEKFIDELTDEELIDCLDYQACQDYR